MKNFKREVLLPAGCRFQFQGKWGIIDTEDIMLETEWEFYENNRDELVEKYCDKFVVISGNKVVAAYDDEDIAYEETVKTIPLGSFMIHHVMEEEEVFTISPVLGV